MMTVSGSDFIPTVSGSDLEAVVQVIDNDTLNDLADKLDVCNTLLLGINDRIDFVIALGVAIAFVVVCYSILRNFSKF